MSRAAVQSPLRLLGPFVGVVVLALAIWTLIWVPRFQASTVALTAETESKDRAELINEYRRTIAQIIGGVVVLSGAIVGAYFTSRQVMLAREGQITDRFTKAISHLGDGKLAVRLGGIYALERIARDSKRDHWTVVETLCAFVRENAPRPLQDAPRNTSEVRQVATDIQAAMTVLGRRQNVGNESESLNLRRTDLSGIELREAHLERADLREAHLEGADLRGAHLTGANIGQAHLAGVNLSGAHLEEAYLTEAHLEGASLWETHLEGAFLLKAHLVGANLQWARLKGASMDGAHLEGADLRDAHLEGAHLWEAHLEGAHLLRANLEYANLLRANLEGAYLEGATLTGASFDRHSIERAFLKDNIGLQEGITGLAMAKPTEKEREAT